MESEDFCEVVAQFVVKHYVGFVLYKKFPLGLKSNNLWSIGQPLCYLPRHVIVC